VKQGESIIVSGGTGSGKTTFLNVLSNYIPSHERIITIEDSAELQILNIPNIVKLETRGSNVEGCREITIRDLIKSALRMRPDRIVVGEVRGPEAIDLLQAMNTGHPGSMSTLHANNAKDMASRLETMVLMGTPLPLIAIRKQIVSGIQLIVQLGRLNDSSRRVLEIAKVVGIRNDEIVTEPVYKLKEIGEDAVGRIKVAWEKDGGIL
jgi:pilus assembly protein CpaF